MPNRLLKEGIVDSAAIDALTADAEVFYYRLLVVADDLGRMDARPAILRARCFPLKESLSTEKIGKWLEALAHAKLLIRYVVDGQPYVAITKWEQRVRSSGKYPPPDDGQLTDNCPTDDGLGLGKGKGKGASNDNQVVFDAERGGFAIPPILRQQWLKAYPAVGLDVELSKASAWLLANPKNAKSNYARFLGGWLQRAQDKAPRVASGSDVFAGAI
jgi:hypothetical protein